MSLRFESFPESYISIQNSSSYGGKYSLEMATTTQSLFNSCVFLCGLSDLSIRFSTPLHPIFFNTTFMSSDDKH